MGTQSLGQPVRIGLTGGIGSGKTTVTDLFTGLGVPVIDADVISRAVVMIDQPAYQAIVREFGPDILDENRELRRDTLRRLIFNDDELKTKLESIIHPLIRDEIKYMVAAVEYPYCIISIALLYESGRQDSVQRVLVVDAPEDLQIQRASNRDGVEADDIKLIIKAQISREKRLQMADDIIKNNRDLQFLQDQVTILHEQYLEMAGNPTK